MSDFKFICPKCGQHIVCDTSNVGMQIGCPGCQTTLTVPPAPPAAPAPNVPGKLTINKSAAGHAAPPPAAKPASGTPSGSISAHRPSAAEPSAKKKNAVLIWGLVVGGVLLVGLVAYFGFVAPAQKKAAEAEREKQEEAGRQLAEQKRKAAEEAAKPKELPISWTMDLSKSKAPDRPAAGMINGQNFKVERATFQSGILTLQQTNGLSSQFVISPIRPTETNFYEVTGEKVTGNPRVTLNWKEQTPGKPGAASFAKDYVMKLELDPPTSPVKISGKIYLCLPDDSQSYLAGRFETGIKAPVAGAPGTKPAGTTRPPRKKSAAPPPPQ